MLDEESVLDVCVNPDGSLWVNRLGKGFLRLGEFSAADSALLLSGIATVRDLELNERSPILETVFPLTGNRIEGLVQPIVSAPAFAIRIRQKLEDMAAAEIITDKQDVRNTKRHPRRLHRARARLVSFGNPATGDEIPPECSTCRTTGSGKTTFANSLIHDWHVQTPGDRAVVIEDTPELQCSLENHVYLLATRKISQGELLVAALRLIPRFQRGLGTAIWPNTVFTGVLPASLLVRRLPQGQFRCCSRYSLTCYETTNFCNPSKTALPSFKFMPSVSIARAARSISITSRRCWDLTRA